VWCPFDFIACRATAKGDVCVLLLSLLSAVRSCDECGMRGGGPHVCTPYISLSRPLSLSRRRLFPLFFELLPSAVCCLLSVLCSVLAREHTTCVSMPGPQHRSNTTLSTCRLVASRLPARATITRAPVRVVDLKAEGRGSTLAAAALVSKIQRIDRKQTASGRALPACSAGGNCYS
jgi:hypothetical protein